MKSWVLLGDQLSKSQTIAEFLHVLDLQPHPSSLVPFKAVFHQKHLEVLCLTCGITVKSDFKRDFIIQQICHFVYSVTYLLTSVKKVIYATFTLPNKAE